MLGDYVDLKSRKRFCVGWRNGSTAPIQQFKTSCNDISKRAIFFWPPHIYCPRIFTQIYTTYINKALKYIWKRKKTEGMVVSNELEVGNSCVVIPLMNSSGPLGKKVVLQEAQGIWT